MVFGRYKEVVNLVFEFIRFLQEEWENREMLFEFKSVLLLRFLNEIIESVFIGYKEYWLLMLSQFKENENVLDLFFVKIYGLENIIFIE